MIGIYRSRLGCVANTLAVDDRFEVRRCDVRVDRDDRRLTLRGDAQTRNAHVVCCLILQHCHFRSADLDRWSRMLKEAVVFVREILFYASSFAPVREET